MKTSLKNSPAQKTESSSVAPKAQDKQAAAAAWRGIFFRGPASRQDKEGEEQPEWHVFLGDDQGEPVRTVYHVHSFKRAESLARVMSTDRKLELIAEAITA